MDVPEARTEILPMVGDTVREALRSWRLPAALTLGVGFGLLERSYSHHGAAFLWGPVAALYTLLLGPLPWRLLVPLEEDGRRGEKLVRWALAGALACAMFAVLAGAYRTVATLSPGSGGLAFAQPREGLVAFLLFAIGGWGLARDIQLEQRLDRTLGRHRELSAQLDRARVDLLRADLDPHFLFNALNAIASQCASDPRAAEDNVVRLASLLRAVLDTRRQALHPLDDELALARDYVGLLHARYPQLAVQWHIDEAARDAEVPPLLLQPLLENAVRHGRIDRGAIVVTARAEGPDLTLTVRSPGAWRGPREGALGCDLVRRRAELAWGDDARCDVGPDGPEATLATVVARNTLPLAATAPTRPA
jgi:two-component system sensor histidine kinase AlgZ